MTVRWLPIIAAGLVGVTLRHITGEFFGAACLDKGTYVERVEVPPAAGAGGRARARADDADAWGRGRPGQETAASQQGSPPHLAPDQVYSTVFPPPPP